MKRLWNRIKKDTNNCWVWQGCTIKDGYGQISINGKIKRVHRVAYELKIGPIPDGLVIDHLCKNKACLNPEHLEAVTPKINTQRAKSDYCKRGHELFGVNLYLYKGSRHCRACRHMRKVGVLV